MKSRPRTCDGDFGFDRVRDVALFVRLVMQAINFLRAWTFVSTEDDLRMERHGADSWRAVATFGHDANGFILITLDLKALSRGKVKPGQHVTARDRCHKRFLGIHTGRIRIWKRNDRRRRGRLNLSPSIETPGVFARIFALEKIRRSSFPRDGSLVFRHSQSQASPSVFGKQKTALSNRTQSRAGNGRALLRNLQLRFVAAIRSRCDVLEKHLSGRVGHSRQGSPRFQTTGGEDGISLAGSTRDCQSHNITVQEHTENGPYEQFRLAARLANGVCHDDRVNTAIRMLHITPQDRSAGRSGDRRSVELPLVRQRSIAPGPDAEKNVAARVHDQRNQRRENRRRTPDAQCRRRTGYGA